MAARAKYDPLQTYMSLKLNGDYAGIFRLKRLTRMSMRRQKAMGQVWHLQMCNQCSSAINNSYFHEFRLGFLFLLLHQVGIPDVAVYLPGAILKLPDRDALALVD